MAEVATRVPAAGHHRLRPFASDSPRRGLSGFSDKVPLSALTNGTRSRRQIAADWFLPVPAGARCQGDDDDS